MKKNIWLGASVFFFNALLLSDLLCGQLPNARLHRVFPCSGKVGSQLEINIAGADLDEATELVFSNPRITGKAKMNPGTEYVAATPIAGQFIVDIPADIIPGVYEVRAFGRFGLSTSRRFVVSDGNESTCTDQNKTSESAMALSPESAVVGRAVANGRHYYKFSLKQNEKISIVCQSKSIDSKMDPVLVISDLSGNEIARGRSTTFDDATIFFKAPIASQYILSVRDAIFSGGADHFYRLSFSKKPFLLAAHPFIIQKGANNDLTLFGWNLPGGKEFDQVNRAAGIESLVVKTSSVLNNSDNQKVSLLTPSSYALNFQNVSLKQNGKPWGNQIPLLVTDRPVVVENQAEPFTTLNLPAEISGRFSPKNETDEYRFAAKKGQIFYIDVYSHRVGKNTDAILTIQQQNQNAETWKNLSVQDDPAGRGGGVVPDFTTSTDDPSVRFQAPADGNYRILIKDQFGTYEKSLDSNYGISVRTPTPDFRLVCHPVYGRAANGNQILASSLSLRRGGRFQVRLQLERMDGFAAPVSISCIGLPEGITCETKTISARQSAAILTFHAKEDAAFGKSLIKVVGTATEGGKKYSHSAVYCGVTWDTGNKGQAPAYFRRTSNLEISVLPHDKAAVTVQAGGGEVLETSLGGKIKLPIKLIRRNKFVDPLKLTAINIPGQMKPKDLTIAKDKSDGTVEVFVKDKNTPLGEYSFSFRGDAKFKYSRNPEAASKQEAEHKRLQDLLKKTQADKTAKTAESDKLNKTMPSLDKAIAMATASLASEGKKQQEAVAQAAALEKQLKEAKENKQNKIGPLVLQAAEKQLASLESQASNSTAVEKAKQMLESANKNKTDAMSKIAELQKQVVSLDERIKKIDAASKSAKSRADQLKKQSAPKDLFYVAVSNPVQIRIVASPLVIEPPKTMTLATESQSNATIKLQRKYGFAEAVNLTFKSPKGISIKPSSMAKDKSDTPIAISVGKDCPVGMHTVEVTAAAKFNNVDVKTTSSFQVQVGAKTSSTAATSKE